MEEKLCEYCKRPMEYVRATKRWCNDECRRRQKAGWPKKRSCRHCGAEFLVETRSDANRQHCSRQCAKNHNAQRVWDWQQKHPDEMKKFTAEWRAKNPNYYKALNAKKRQASLDLLGGVCVVCGVSNPLWLHIDYVPGSRGIRYRHPRGIRYLREHIEDFRILCANHHYELTLSGQIEGTDITQ